jgi:hypothetical protein
MVRSKSRAKCTDTVGAEPEPRGVLRLRQCVRKALVPASLVQYQTLGNRSGCPTFRDTIFQTHLF